MMTLLLQLWAGGAVAMQLKTIAGEFLDGWPSPVDDLLWYLVYDLCWPVTLAGALLLDREDGR